MDGFRCISLDFKCSNIIKNKLPEGYIKTYILLFFYKIRNLF